MDVWLLILRLVLAGLLYAFLAAVMVFLWRDLRREEAAPTRVNARLVVLHSDDERLTEGEVFPLQPVTSIGRSPGNTVVLPDTYASAHHTLLTWREGQWWLEDLDSRNGTFLNEVAISAPTVVSAGDVIVIGRTRLKLELGG